MFSVDLEGVASIVAVHREGRNQQSPVDADCVHRRHHIVAGDLIRTLQEPAARDAQDGYARRHVLVQSIVRVRVAIVFLLVIHRCRVGVRPAARDIAWRKGGPAARITGLSPITAVSFQESTR